ncbi:MAG TPA: amidase family protein, partial [Acidimicrobiales bacterium]|nr:amidase family protein [Acidimicrobiales bacterium]
VDRVLAAGAVPVAKTNLDEFAMGSSTENSAFGPTRNPLDPARVPGGSSGGSAAAVAAGMAPLALGSDTGGSIRQPAALCGLVGVKPTYGLVSRYGLIAFASSLDQIGPLSTTVADAALCLEVIGGNDPRDSTSLPGGPPELVSHLDDGVDGWRVGLVAELVEGADPEVAAAVTRAARVLEAAGATLVELSIPEVRLGLSAYYLLAPAEASSNLARYDGVRYGLRVDADDVTAMNVATRTAGFGDEVKRRVMLGTYALSAGYYDAYYGQALKVRTRTIEAFARAYERCDILLGATTPGVAFAFGTKTADPMQMYLNDVYTIPTNLTGEAAVSVPFGAGEAGLPVGVQLVGPSRSEARLLAAARVLEASEGRG